MTGSTTLYAKLNHFANLFKPPALSEGFFYIILYGENLGKEWNPWMNF